MATTAMPADRWRPKAFLPRHPSDRTFILVYIALIWLGVIAGFANDIADRYHRGAATYPAIVYIHGTAFVGWLLLLTVQALLIRARKVRIHRKLGVLGAVLAAAMVFLGLVAGMTMHRLRVGTPDAEPAFLAIQLMDMIGFGGLVAAAVVARNRPAAHKRLILLATLSIADAGFARFIAGPLHHALGSNTPWHYWLALFGPSYLLVLGIGIYDWTTRGRVHPAWAWGAIWIFCEQMTASWLYFDPGWKTLAMSVIGPGR